MWRFARRLFMGPIRILVVDDDAVLSGMLAETLISMGHVVCGLESTESGAVSAAARFLPDLLLVDVRLGTGSGVRAVEQILRARPVPYVMISGDRMGPGIIGLRKPFRPADLARCIDVALAGSARVRLPTGSSAIE